MPLYVYGCPECELELEELRPAWRADEPVECPICHGFCKREVSRFHGLKVAVMVNDFGSINIDTRLVVGVEGEAVSLANGCICCTIC